MIPSLLGVLEGDAAAVRQKPAGGEDAEMVDEAA